MHVRQSLGKHRNHHHRSLLSRTSFSLPTTTTTPTAVCCRLHPAPRRRQRQHTASNEFEDPLPAKLVPSAHIATRRATFRARAAPPAPPPRRRRPRHRAAAHAAAAAAPLAKLVALPQPLSFRWRQDARAPVLSLPLPLPSDPAGLLHDEHRARVVWHAGHGRQDQRQYRDVLSVRPRLHDPQSPDPRAQVLRAMDARRIQETALAARPPPTRPVVPGMHLAPHPSSSRESSPTRTSSGKPRKSLSGSDLPQVVVSFPTDPALLLQYNAKVRENYLEHVRLECEWCGRKFADEERLAVHNRSCTQENPAKRRGSATLTGAVPPSGPALAGTLERVTPLRKSQSAMHLSSPPSASNAAGPPQAGAGTVKPRRSFMLFGRKSQSAAADETPKVPEREKEKEKEKEKETEHLAIPARTVSARPRRASAAPALSVTTASPSSSSSASNALPVPPKSPRTSVSSRRSSPLAVMTSASHRRASSSSAVSTSSSSAPGGPVVSVSATVNAGSGSGKARFCVQCGKKYADADRFCAHCGNRR
ncbi:hypothetical protein AMAG_01552, partial [Allomyces macrogynus ATCC 38327]